MLAKQAAQHPDRAHHAVAPHLALAELSGGRRRDRPRPQRDVRERGGSAARRGRHRLGHHAHQQSGSSAYVAQRISTSPGPAVPDQRQLAGQRRGRTPAPRSASASRSIVRCGRAGAATTGSRARPGRRGGAPRRATARWRRRIPAAGMTSRPHRIRSIDAVRRAQQDRRRRQHPAVHDVVAAEQDQLAQPLVVEVAPGRRRAASQRVDVGDEVAGVAAGPRGQADQVVGERRRRRGAARRGRGVRADGSCVTEERQALRRCGRRIP